jgi:hypothetical protein
VQISVLRVSPTPPASCSSCDRWTVELLVQLERPEQLYLDFPEDLHVSILALEIRSESHAVIYTVGEGNVMMMILMRHGYGLPLTVQDPTVDHGWYPESTSENEVEPHVQGTT